MSKKEVQFHDYYYMINKLKQKGMIIDNNKIAIELLKSVGYYNLINRYKSEFYLPDKKEYRENIHIDDLYYYHRIEDDLRNILFQFAIKLEQRFKESMAFTISKNMGVKMGHYLNPYKYRNKNKAIGIMEFMNKDIDRCRDNPTKYYRDEYGDVPPWIMLSNISFGQARMLFSIFPREMTEYVMIQLLPINSKDEYEFEDFILNKLVGYDASEDHTDEELDKIVFEDKNILIEFVRNIISLVHDFRNNLAHGNRLIHFKSNTKIQIKVLRIFCGKNVFSKSEYYDKKLCSNDLFALMVSLVITMDKYDSIAFIAQLEAWQKTNTATETTNKQYNQFIKSCELPKNFIKRLKLISIEKTYKQTNEEFNKKFSQQ